ncbi:hypothetical protein TNCV_3233131 [Trichonephila clavipes]|nr:hypothetical protein TNCV_3233131 [Trichonephila clavipes]
MIGSVIWQAYEPSHHDLPTAVQRFFAEVNSASCRSRVMPVPHGAAQRRRNMYCVKKFGQELLLENQICPTVQSRDRQSGGLRENFTGPPKKEEHIYSSRYVFKESQIICPRTK